jgi:hypothetical protein
MKKQAATTSTPEHSSAPPPHPLPHPPLSRHDPATGALIDPHTPPSSHSASDYKRFLSSPEFHDHPLAYLPGIYLFVGSLGAGKSTAVHGLMEEFDAIMDPKTRGRVVYYSGSGSDKLLDSYDDEVVEKFDKRSKESFQTALRELYNDAAETPHEKKKHNIVVVDDGVMDQDLLPQSVKSDTPLMRLAMSARHIPLSLIVTAQKHSAIPSFMRANASHMFVFKTKTPSEMESVMKDVNFSKEEFKRSMDSLTDPSDFIWVQNYHRRLIKNYTTGLIR